MLGVAFGVYPSVDVADAHGAVQIDGQKDLNDGVRRD